MSLGDVEKELYGQKPRKLRVDQAKKEEISRKTEGSEFKNPWRDEEPYAPSAQGPEPVQKAEKIGSRVFIVLAGALVVLVGFAGYYLYQYFSTKDARFTITAPAEVRIGEPFTLTAVFENISKKPLYEPVLSIQLPDGAVVVDNASRRTIEEQLPDTASGEGVKREFTVVLTGTSYRSYRFGGDISFRYGESTLSSKFQKEAFVSVVARDPVLTLDIAIPASVVNGQDFELQTRYKSETGSALRNVSIVFDLPSAFSLNNSEPKLEESGDKRKVTFQEIAAGSEGVVIISGFLTGSANTFVPFGAKAVLSVSGSEYEIASKNNSISVGASPLEVIVLSDKKEDVAHPGDDVKFTMRIQNNASIPLREVVASAKFNGAHFDLSSLEGSGSLNDATRTYTWTAARISELERLEPGRSVEIPFSISLRNGYAPQGVVQKDIELQVVGMAASATVPPELTAQQTIGTHTYTLKLGGVLNLLPLVFYAEPSEEIRNIGPVPPRAGQETQFTIHWKLSAQGTDAQKIQIRASLGRGMEWTGKLSVLNTESAPRYNSQTQEVIWEIPNITAGSAAPEAIFQIIFTPASNMADANALQNGYDKVRP